MQTVVVVQSSGVASSRSTGTAPLLVIGACAVEAVAAASDLDPHDFPDRAGAAEDEKEEEDGRAKKEGDTKKNQKQEAAEGVEGKRRRS